MTQQQVYTLIGTLLSWGIGYFGADRFYRGEIALGIVKLITFGGFGIWWLVDAIIWSKRLGDSLRVPTV